MDSSLQVLNIRAGSMILRFLGCSGRGLSLELLVFLNTKLNWKWHREIILWPCCTRFDGIPVNSGTFADEKTWLELIGTAGRTFSYMHAAGGFAEAAGTELCKGNVELDCAGRYPLAMWNNSRLSLAVRYINVSGFTTFFPFYRPWLSCSSDVFWRLRFISIHFRNFFVRYKGKTSVVNCYCSCVLFKKMRIFNGGKNSVLCSGISVGWMFNFVCSCCEAINDAVEGSTSSEHVAYPQRNSSE